MSIIGNYKYYPDVDTYGGHIVTLTLTRHGVTFRPNEKSNEKEPDYRILYEGFELGAAWKRTSKEGRQFLSVSIDDPALPAPLNGALLPAQDGETAVLVWSRSKPGKGEDKPVDEHAPGSVKPKKKAA